MNHEMIVTISKGQQITIPSSIRDELGLGIGSRVDISQKGKEIIITAVGEDLETLFAKAKKCKPKHHLSAQDMDTLNEGLLR
tara:strand:+ start:13 stop:258 length:246 start_codon:yes stop_codon:yes gene_type:complete